MTNYCLRYNDCVNNESSTCWDCNRNGSPERDVELTDNYVSPLDQANKLFEYLKGELPEGIDCFTPKLSSKEAFSVVWFIQEIIDCLPDHIEICQHCEELFDTNKEGYSLSEEYTLDGKPLPEEYRGHWCDSCVPQVDWEFP